MEQALGRSGNTSSDLLLAKNQGPLRIITLKKNLNVVDLVSYTGENKEALSRAKTKMGISMKRREKCQEHHCSYVSRIAAVF